MQFLSSQDKFKANHLFSSSSSSSEILFVESKFEFVARGGSRGDVGDASPHQPFSNMFLMNTIFL